MEASPIRRLRRTITTDNIWLYILNLLAKTPLHAYEMHKLMKKRFGWAPNLISMYVVLYRLEAEGLVESESKGRRKVYKITKKGRTVYNYGKRVLRTLLQKLK